MQRYPVRRCPSHQGGGCILPFERSDQFDQLRARLFFIQNNVSRLILLKFFFSSYLCSDLTSDNGILDVFNCRNDLSIAFLQDLQGILSGDMNVASEQTLSIDFDNLVGKFPTVQISLSFAANLGVCFR